MGPVAVKTQYPALWKLFTGRDAQKIEVYEEEKQECDLFISSLAVVTTLKNGALYELNREFIHSHQMEHYVMAHPYKDGVMAEMLGHHGYNRETLPSAMLGFHNVPFAKLTLTPLEAFWKKKYITVHDGVGAYHYGNVSRGTKMWDLSHWKDFVALFKEAHPDIDVIQLGCETSRKISGVDYSFLGSFSLETSFKILAYSRLHIDGESGMVHAAKALGVKSVVLFGPTPARFFSHEGNINIQTNACPSCWWSTDTWLARCPRGYRGPICMNSIYPEAVMVEVDKELSGEKVL